MSASPSAAGKKPVAPLSNVRRFVIILVSSLLAVALVMGLLVYFAGNSAKELDAMSVPQVNELAAEQVEGLEGLIEIADVTLGDSDGRVFFEEARDNLRAEQAKTQQFLADLPEADDAASKQQAVDRLRLVENQFAELFETIRLVQKDMKQWDDAH